MKKVLGISFGRKGQNCDTIAKQALLGARKLGAEVRFLNTSSLLIRSCVGCFGCSHSREQGGDGLCVLKDDMRRVEDAILEADGVILVVPVYSVGPNGQFKCLVDRMGLSHDRAFSDAARAQIEDSGGDPAQIMDMRVFKDRYLGLVSVGGASDEGWTAMGLPNLHLIAFSMQMPVVDQLNVYDTNILVNPVFHESLLSRIDLLGQHVASAIGAPDKYQVPYMGDEPGICPACHNNLLKIEGGVQVSCPVCGMRGKLAIRDDHITVDFPPEEFQHSRMRYGGVKEHMEELLTIAQRIPKETMQKLPELKQALARYNGIPEAGQDKVGT